MWCRCANHFSTFFILFHLILFNFISSFPYFTSPPNDKTDHRSRRSCWKTSISPNATGAHIALPNPVVSVRWQYEVWRIKPCQDTVLRVCALICERCLLLSHVQRFKCVKLDQKFSGSDRNVVKEICVKSESAEKMVKYQEWTVSVLALLLKRFPVRIQPDDSSGQLSGAGKLRTQEIEDTGRFSIIQYVM